MTEPAAPNDLAFPRHVLAEIIKEAKIADLDRQAILTERLDYLAAYYRNVLSSMPNEFGRYAPFDATLTERVDWIVQIWSEDERAPFRNLGRPTLVTTSPGRSPTLDFLFECRRTGRRFVVEQKCEIEFNGFRYFTLNSPDQLKHHIKPAFAAFLAAANGSVPGARDWKVGGQRVTVDGAILVWGAVTQEGRTAVMEETGLHDVIGLDRIIAECARWRPDAYCRLVSDRRRWCEELFEFLDG